MTAAPPPVPAYGGGALADVVPAVAAHLGVGGCVDLLGVVPARRACVLLVDGLGWELLRRHADAAPFLAGLVPTGRSLTAGFPTTTATSVASLGTGLPPGGHGLLGYQFLLPGDLLPDGEPALVNALRWNTPAVPEEVQPAETVFARAAASGVAVAQVAPRGFAGTGLTRATVRGAPLVGAEGPGELVGATARAVAASDRTLVYSYYGSLDTVGHLRGCGSDDWLAELAHVDLLARQMAERLPDGAVLHVTADHGMVDVPLDARRDVDTEPDLHDGVAFLGGEARARHVYTVPGAAADVLATWRSALGDGAWVLSREEAIEVGWFGPQVQPWVRARVGDVVVASAGDLAVIASVAEPLESSLVGMHGSLTADELRVPLLTVAA